MVNLFFNVGRGSKDGEMKEGKSHQHCLAVRLGTPFYAGAFVPSPFYCSSLMHMIGFKVYKLHGHLATCHSILALEKVNLSYSQILLSQWR